VPLGLDFGVEDRLHAVVVQAGADLMNQSRT
jgi:hypothetical protein